MFYPRSVGPTRIAVIVALLSAGCIASTEWTQMRTPPRPMRSRPIGSVQMFASAPPRWRYVEVGIIEERESDLNGSGEYVLAHIRNEAAERGCDGLLLNITDHQTSSLFVGRGIVAARSGTERGYRAICIMYDGP